MEEKYYTVEQVAGWIGLHPKTVQRYIREGRLRAQKIGKAWRVTGHDLSTFMEGTEQTAPAAASPGMQEIIGTASAGIRVSAVIDIPVRDRGEAVRIVNWVTATLHSRPSEFGYTSMSSQFIEPDHLVRILLWGSPALMEAIMGSIRALQPEGEGEES